MTNYILSLFISLNILPDVASYIGIYNDSGAKVGIVSNETESQHEDECLYKVGVFSDVHLAGDLKVSMTNFLNALTYVTQSEDVEFSFVSGDIGLTYYNGWIEWARFKTVVDQVPGAVVYPTTGNHDVPSWSGGVVDIELFKSKTGTSELYTSAATNSYEVTKVHTALDGTIVTDHYLFLGMKNCYQVDSQYLVEPYLYSDIDWLEKKLEQYKSDRSFIITHLFFPNASGNLKMRYNWLNLHGNQLNRLLWLRYNYKNTYWFSGHSHWDLRYQNIELDANIHPISNDGRSEGWAIHDGSCNRVRWYESYSQQDQYIDASQGSVAHVYKDHIDLVGIVFREHNKSFSPMKIPIASYRLPTTPSGIVKTNMTYVTGEMIHAVPGKTSPSVYVDETNHDLAITFSSSNQVFSIYEASGIKTNSQVRVFFDSVAWVAEEPSQSALNDIGFYLNGMHASGMPEYTVVSGSLVDTSSGGIEVGTSGDYTAKGGSGVTLTLTNVRYAIIGN